jgi:molybdopterin converting factor small subunit
MSIETNGDTKTKVWGGVLFLVGYWLVVGSLVKALATNTNYTMADSFSMGIGVTTFLSIIIYVLLAKKLHFDRNKKIVSLILLFIFVNVSSFYLGRYYYHDSIKASLSFMTGLNAQQKQVELNDINNKIYALSQTIQEEPRNKQEANEHINVIDQLTELYKKSYNLTSNVQDEIIRNVNTNRFLKPDELKIFIKKQTGTNVDVLPEFQNQQAIWFKALNGCLSAKKEYYQSYVNDEPVQAQEYLIKKTNDVCPVYGHEEAKLIESFLFRKA